MTENKMFNKIRCKTCIGSGRVMGGGMIIHDCDDCEGTGKLYIPIDNSSIDPDFNNKKKHKDKDVHAR